MTNLLRDLYKNTTFVHSVFEKNNIILIEGNSYTYKTTLAASLLLNVISKITTGRIAIIGDLSYDKYLYEMIDNSVPVTSNITVSQIPLTMYIDNHSNYDYVIFDDVFLYTQDVIETIINISYSRYIKTIVVNNRVSSKTNELRRSAFNIPTNGDLLKTLKVYNRSHKIDYLKNKITS